MIKEIDLFGIFLPPLLAHACAAWLLWLALRRGLAAAGVYRHVWHPALFNAALYVIVLAGLVAVLVRQDV